MILMTPPLDTEGWPTLGPLVCDWIEGNLVFGPGDLRGQPAKLEAEKRALIGRMYEYYPAGTPNAGRRRFRRVALSLRKGSAKSELAAWIAAAELHPDGPVRVLGWDGDRPRVGGVTDPYIPLVAYTEEQSEELVYGALRVILAEGPLARDFDIAQNRIMRRAGDGKAVPLASSPNARDGARTTFQALDETHRWTSDRLREAHRTMLANLPKRRIADPWSLETTTAPAPGEYSVAEHTMEYARLVIGGQRNDSRLFFFHRQASDGHDLTTEAGVRAAVLEASGPVAAWSDVDGIVEQWQDPTADRAYLERVWLNRVVRSSERAFDMVRWGGCLKPDDVEPADGAVITIGFDGARTRDATALVGTEIATGYQWVVGLWERPATVAPDGEWEVPEQEVEDTLTAAMARWSVWRVYCDPYRWETTIARWAGKWGEKVIAYFWTTRTRQMATALRNYHQAIAAGDVRHAGDPDLTRHLANAVRKRLYLRDDNDQPLWLIQKERPDSPMKIDAAMAAVLSWEARTHAMALGVGQPVAPSVYEERGFVRL